MGNCVPTEAGLMSLSRTATCVGTPAWLLWLILAPQGLSAQEPTLDVVLARVAAYATQFRNGLSGIVTEERYDQSALPPSADATLGRGVPPTGRRASRSNTERIILRSDFLLVRPPGADRAIEFRDVFEVNGRATRDRDERLTRLFLNPTSSSMAQVQRITNESARYNIGTIQRTLNTPTLPLLFLEQPLQHRFTFTRVDDREPTLELSAPIAPPSADVWVVVYEEAPGRTLIRGRDDKDFPVRGRFWIQPAEGRVVATELMLQDAEVEATVDVRYQFNTGIDHVVPVEMRELYRDLHGAQVEGTATYSNFRRFQVKVEEVLPAPGAPSSSAR